MGICFLTFAVRARAEQKWTKINSANFEMFSTSGEKAGRRMILYFEQLRSFFAQAMGLKMRSSLPVRIVAFRSEKEFGPYRIRESSAAFYLSGHDRDYIVMSKVSSDARSVAVHEYVHLLVNHSGVSLPTWFNEGLATLYSTLTPLAGKIKVGDIFFWGGPL